MCGEVQGASHHSRPDDPLGLSRELWRSDRGPPEGGSAHSASRRGPAERVCDEFTPSLRLPSALSEKQDGHAIACAVGEEEN